MKEETEIAFRRWLKSERRNNPDVISDKISRCHRVEDCYGDLDDLFDQGGIDPLLDVLCCSPSGEPRHRIRFPRGVNPVTGTASIKNAVRAYREFRMSR